LWFLLAHQIQFINLSCVKESCSFRETLVHCKMHCNINLSHIFISVVLSLFFIGYATILHPRCFWFRYLPILTWCICWTRWLAINKSFGISIIYHMHISPPEFKIGIFVVCMGYEIPISFLYFSCSFPLMNYLMFSKAFDSYSLFEFFDLVSSVFLLF